MTADYPKMLLMVLAMAGVTYLIRTLPMLFIRKKITNNFICSLLYYIPYAVLSAMTFPYIFYSTDNFWAALIGTVVALISAMTLKKLILVALLTCVAVLIAGFVL